MAARIASWNAVRFITGSEPGIPRHTGHVAVFGGWPNLLRHPQNSFVAVSNWTCTSNPITILYGSDINHLRMRSSEFGMRNGKPSTAPRLESAEIVAGGVNAVRPVQILHS